MESEIKVPSGNNTENVSKNKRINECCISSKLCVIIVELSPTGELGLLPSLRVSGHVHSRT